MKTKNIECTYCGGASFNLIERRVTERASMQTESGKLTVAGGVAKTPELTVVCRGCGGEYGAHELIEENAAGF